MKWLFIIHTRDYILFWVSLLCHTRENYFSYSRKLFIHVREKHLPKIVFFKHLSSYSYWRNLIFSKVNFLRFSYECYIFSVNVLQFILLINLTRLVMKNVNCPVILEILGVFHRLFILITNLIFGVLYSSSYPQETIHVCLLILHFSHFF